MSFDFSTLVTDRSQTDLDSLRALLAVPLADWTAEQLAAFNAAISKGAYNYTDLNRVIAAMDDINERLTAAGYVTGYQPIIVHPVDSPTGRLPEGYTELEYIQSSGTQCIDTGFKPNQDTRAVIKIQCLEGSTDGNYPGILSARNSDFSNSFSLFITSAKRYMTAYNANMGDDFGAFDTQIHVFDKNKGVTYFDDTEVSTIVSSDFQCGFNLFLLAASSGANPAYDFLSAKIFYCQIYDNGTLVRDYVPCINQSGQIGLYDLVTFSFYGNSGSGTFVAGGEIDPPEPTPVLDPYTWYESDMPTASTMTEYLSNVGRLKNALTLPDDAPKTPGTMAGLTQTEANDIEAILVMIDAYLMALQAIFLRSGMTWAVTGGPSFYFPN